VGDTKLGIFKLHEQALARGARPHWLGYIRVDDVDVAQAAFLARGATSYGKWVNPEGLEAAVLRDPGGAIVAVAKGPTGDEGPDVLAYQLLTNDVAKAKTHYAELFGWSFGPPEDLGEHGLFHPFSWDEGGAAAGSMTDIAERPGVHPHWLFHMRVPVLDRAVEMVRSHGGLVAGVFTLGNGDRLAVCDDPQGAAFALREAAAD
jgi:predicted enzyme related to lactoylglutathione lyase